MHTARFTFFISFIRHTIVALCFALPMAADAQQLTVSAAASLTDAFKEIGARFVATRPGVTLRFNFAASGVLLQQIKQGAPIDVLATADQETVVRGIEAKWLDAATKRDFATNDVVLIVPAGNGSTVKALVDLAQPNIQRIAIGKPSTVPVGHYTEQALTETGLWSVLTPKYVQADSVRQVLDYVARSEAEAGFVYRTDAMLVPDKVHIVLALTGHEPVSYPVVMVSSTQQAALASDFIAFLTTPVAQRILSRYGFGKA